ncbi:7-cyano-7-deazaguanine synthase QueC [Acidimicrobiia bacterium EGI L10123]|uniref:7-cyano-7-deazaguanine synthase QueC n=1 Tax=Salinilacustrithrix flava TaxID=2957203 RepID=UPI003D7C240A|nr:7-cyano-7-deazaguanine synthase QueC [Acidimicrobiia bacterium EGI L10123]
MTRPAVVLLSGGLDSATCLAIAADEGLAPHAMSFRYGQAHTAELDAARRVASALGAVEHRVVDIDLAAFGGSSLLGDGEIPKGREEIGEGIPSTYVPARNTVFLAYALAWAEVLGANDIFIGVNALDYSGYPDCRPEFIAAFEAAANAGTRTGTEGDGYRIRAPLIDLTKAEIIRLGTGLGVDYAMTVTCYDATPEGACGECDACMLRRRGFEEAGVPDPTSYRP